MIGPDSGLRLALTALRAAPQKEVKRYVPLKYTLYSYIPYHMTIRPIARQLATTYVCLATLTPIGRK